MSRKHKLWEDGKKKIQERLTEIEELQKNLIDCVENLTSPVCRNGKALLAVQDKSLFLLQYSSIMQDMEKCRNALFLASMTLDEQEETIASQQGCPDHQSTSATTYSSALTSDAAATYSSALTSDVAATYSSELASDGAANYSFELISGAATYSPAPGLTLLSNEIFSHSTGVTGPSDSTLVTLPVAMMPATLLKDELGCKPPSEASDSSKTSHSNKTRTTKESSLRKKAVGKALRKKRSKNKKEAADTDNKSSSTEAQSSVVSEPLRECVIPTMTFVENCTLDVVITEVTSPWFFWAQPAYSEAEELETKMWVFYEKDHEEYKFKSSPSVGSFVSAKYNHNNSWYRAKVTSVHDMESEESNSTQEVEVVYVDYGNRERLPLDRIRHLTPNFAQLPTQAFYCALSQVSPPDGSTVWSPEYNLIFLHLVENKVLHASIYQEPGCPLLFLDLHFPGQPLPMTAAGGSHVSGPITSVMESVGDLMRKYHAAKRMSNAEIAACVFPKSCPGFAEDGSDFSQSRKSPEGSNGSTSTDGVQMAAEGTGSVANSKETLVQSCHQSPAAVTSSELDGGKESLLHSEADLRDKILNTTTVSGCGDRKSMCTTREVETVSECGDGKSVLKAGNTCMKTPLDDDTEKSNVDLSAANVEHIPNSKVIDNSQARPNLETEEKNGSTCKESDLVPSEVGRSHEAESVSVSKEDVPSDPNDDDLANEVADLSFDEQLDQEIEACKKTDTETTDLDLQCGQKPAAETTNSILRQEAENLEESHSGTKTSKDEKALTPQQKLRSLGFPDRLPKSCEFQEEFQSWLANKNVEEDDSMKRGTAVGGISKDMDTSGSKSALAAAGGISKDLDSAGKKLSSEGPKAIDSDLPLMQADAGKKRTARSPLTIVPQSTKVAEDLSLSLKDFSPSARSPIKEIPLKQEAATSKDKQESVSVAAVPLQHISSKTVLPASGQLTSSHQVVEPQSHIPQDRSSLPVTPAQSHPVNPPGGATLSMNHPRPTTPTFIKSPKSHKNGLPDLQLNIPDDGCLQFMMSHVESPNHFFVHLVTPESAMLDQMMEELNDHFSKINLPVLMKFFEGDEPAKHDICCALYRQDNKFYRAEVLGMRYETTSDTEEESQSNSTSNTEESPRCCAVRVLYIDFGNSEWIPRENLYPLPPKFFGIPPLACRCNLADVSPLEVSGNDQQMTIDGWTYETVREFDKMTGYDSVLLGYVVEPYPTSSKQPLNLILLNTSGTNEVWVNVELVRKGLAKSEVFGKVGAQTTEGLLTEPQICVPEQGVNNEPAASMPAPMEETSVDPAAELQDWDPMAEDHLSIRNSYAIDPEDPGVATTGHASYGEKVPCKFYLTPEGCWRGQECPFPHVTPGTILSEQQREVYSAEDTENTVCPAENSWVAVEITSLYNPCHFYVTFPFGTRPLQHFISREQSDDGYEGSIGLEALELLMEEINEDYSNSVYRDTDLVVHACGEIVVAQFSDDDLWYRAKVIDTDVDNEKVEVFYLDFGNTEWVAENRLRTIKKNYLGLPFQAVECFLAEVEANCPDGKWTQEAKEYFSNITDGKVMFARVVKRHHNCTLKVHLYDSSGEVDVNIADALVEAGYAKKVTEAITQNSPSDNNGKKPQKPLNWIPG